MPVIRIKNTYRLLLVFCLLAGTPFSSAVPSASCAGLDPSDCCGACRDHGSGVPGEDLDAQSKGDMTISDPLPECDFCVIKAGPVQNVERVFVLPAAPQIKDVKVKKSNPAICRVRDTGSVSSLRLRSRTGFERCRSGLFSFVPLYYSFSTLRF